MRTLILSCNTGAGHNSCAKALQETFTAHGEVCDIIDALQFISERASQFISNWHTRIYLYAPSFSRPDIRARRTMILSSAREPEYISS